MKITAIKAQVKKPDRVSIFIDEKYSFSLSQNQLLEERLHVGLEVTEVRLKALHKVSGFGKAYDRILNYIALRPRSQREIEQYARRKEIDPEDCHIIVEKLKKLGYVNDAQFAKSWVRSRAAAKPVSKRRLQAELSQKGVRDVEQKEAIEVYDERDALRRVIAKKARLARYAHDQQKFMQYLARQGFAFDDIKRELEEFKNNSEL